MILIFFFRYKYSHEKERLWRKNRNAPPGMTSCVGTDLNRNWDYHWGESGASRYKCAEIYRGPVASSEPETQAVIKYIMKNPKIFKVNQTICTFNITNINIRLKVNIFRDL